MGVGWGGGAGVEGRKKPRVEGIEGVAPKSSSAPSRGLHKGKRAERPPLPHAPGEEGRVCVWGVGGVRKGLGGAPRYQGLSGVHPTLQ